MILINLKSGEKTEVLECLDSASFRRAVPYFEDLPEDIKGYHAQLALTYALAIKSREEKDWKKINKAIVKKWSLSGLKRVKKLAWIGFEKDFWKMIFEKTIR